MGLYPKEILEYLTLSGVPRGMYSNIYCVDTANGSASNAGDRWKQPYASVATAYAACTTAQHDTILMVGSGTADTLAAAITWSKNFTHLVGLTNDLPGIGQRCRVVGGATTDLTVIATVSGTGNYFRNIQFYNGADADVDNGAVVVSGSRNVFENCAFVGMQHATPAARAGSYSLKVTGSENYFKSCMIGYDSITRGAGEPPELWLATGCSKAIFEDCMILCRSETATASPVKIDAVNLGLVVFKNCLFANTSTNWATSLTDCFTITATGTHYIALNGNNQLVGITGWADTPTRMYQNLPTPANTGGTNVAPTT